MLTVSKLSLEPCKTSTLARISPYLVFATIPAGMVAKTKRRRNLAPKLDAAGVRASSLPRKYRYARYGRRPAWKSLVSTPANLAPRVVPSVTDHASTATSAMGSDSRVAAGEMDDVAPAVSLATSIAGTNPSAGAMDADGAGAGAARGPVRNLLDGDPGEGAQRRAGAAAVTRETRLDDAGPSDRERGADLAHLATTGGVKVDIAILPCALHL